MSASTLVHHGLRINNRNGCIERVPFDSRDFSLFKQEDSLQRITEELESSAVAITISENKAQLIEDIFSSKEILIAERNAILGNLFKHYNPFYWKRLRKIDAKLDGLDMQLYNLESEAKQIEFELDRAIALSKEKLERVLACQPAPEPRRPSMR